MSPWEQIGFVPSAQQNRDGLADTVIDAVDLRLGFSDELRFGSSGLFGWRFRAEIDESSVRLEELSIDGVPTWIQRSGEIQQNATRQTESHRLNIIGVDHVVVMTGSLERTSQAIVDAVGEPLRRIRDAGKGVRQGFHKSGPVILEVVERPDIDPQTPSWLWGLVFTVADLDEAVQWLGPDAIGSPRDAVQPGRRIASLRAEAGLGVPVALITPKN